MIEIDRKVSLGISMGPSLNMGDMFPKGFEVVNASTDEIISLDNSILFSEDNEHCLVILLRHFA